VGGDASSVLVPALGFVLHVDRRLLRMRGVSVRSGQGNHAQLRLLVRALLLLPFVFGAPGAPALRLPLPLLPPPLPPPCNTAEADADATEHHGQNDVQRLSAVQHGHR
jgi:hypothetical protein